MQDRVNWMSSVLAAITVGLQPVTSIADPAVQTQSGKASYYGKGFHGKKTASGERFNQKELVAAHPSWSFGTLVRVINKENGRSVKVRIVDRGPAKKARRRGVIIDVSTEAAKSMNFHDQGIAPVRLEVLKWGRKPGKG